MEWISIKDQMPNDWEVVFICLSNLLPKKYYIGFYHPTFKAWQQEDGGSIPKDYVTHYQIITPPSK